ncbi:hypothetical protein Pmar_PMAR012821 [Perkinsus marinus ATCC 50983]|uniref:Uncharacterized protein n=1 Tax=Perkinsus marinus (strain ATCC 50983 / TXsc) TaxID=423536 RepID=C5L5H8_PERM5|nr:hypothetical protein Pmar_PMAR012821 [Perkinsus marinus ATCC 50983]EER08003.1 hypothetical protein Pmar_PMAR012821 [Perkinsus marinus ATCC 50983]|eukprot:XP_002776187.1 hypothetical protein Pmar_PMAR012821 [Perkinsus marinus ATCC 50983]
MRIVPFYYLVVFALVNPVTADDPCQKLCDDTPGCELSYCMSWKVPAACHDLLNRTDGFLCSASYDATCGGSPIECGDPIISSPGPTVTTITTTTESTVFIPIVSEEALSGTWCSADLSQPDVTPIEVVSFAGDKVMFLYDGEVYYKQYYYEANQVYVYGEDWEVEQKIGKPFADLRFAYFGDSMLAIWSEIDRSRQGRRLPQNGEVVGHLTRTGVDLDCDPLPGAEAPPPSVDDIANTRWCNAGEPEKQQPVELRFTSSYAILYLPLSSIILPAKFEVRGNSYDINLYELDEGFEALSDLGSGNFEIIYYGDWLFMVFQDGQGRGPLRLDLC